LTTWPNSQSSLGLTLETEYSAKFFNLLCGHCDALDAGAEILKKATATATKEFRNGSALLGEAEDEDVEEEDIDNWDQP